jgi:hypothetical protein
VYPLAQSNAITYVASGIWHLEGFLLAIRRNSVLNLVGSPESAAIMMALLASTKDKGEGRIKCTVTKHRLAKTAIVIGIQILKRKPQSTLKQLIEKWAPRKVRGRICSNFVLVLECTSTQGLLEGVDYVWRQTFGAVSHRRVMTAALCIGIETLNKVDHTKMRQLVSKVCPVSKKYWDPEVNQWL